MQITHLNVAAVMPTSKRKKSSAFCISLSSNVLHKSQLQQCLQAMRFPCDSALAGRQLKLTELLDLGMTRK